MDMLGKILDLMETMATIGGGVLLVWGAIQFGTNLKDHNGPALAQAIWQILGGAIIIIAAQWFGTII